MNSIKAFLQDILTNDKVARIYPDLDGPMGSFVRNVINDVFSGSELAIVIRPSEYTHKSEEIIVDNNAVYIPPTISYISRPFYDYQPNNFVSVFSQSQFNITPAPIDYYPFCYKSNQFAIFTNTSLILTDGKFYQNIDLYEIAESQAIDPNDLRNITYAIYGSIPNLDTSTIQTGWFIFTHYDSRFFQPPSRTVMYFYDETTQTIFVKNLSEIEDYSLPSGTINLSNKQPRMGFFLETFAPLFNKNLKVTPSYYRKELTWSYFVVGINEGNMYLMRARIENNTLDVNVLAYTNTASSGYEISNGYNLLSCLTNEGNICYNVNRSPNSSSFALSKHQIIYERDVYRERGNYRSEIRFINSKHLDMSEVMRPSTSYDSADYINSIAKINDNFYLTYHINFEVYPADLTKLNITSLLLKTNSDFDIIDVLAPSKVTQYYASFYTKYLERTFEETIPIPHKVFTDGTTLFSIDYGTISIGQTYPPPTYPAFSIINIPVSFNNQYLQFTKYFRTPVRIRLLGVGGDSIYTAYYKTNQNSSWKTLPMNSYTEQAVKFDIKIELNGVYPQNINNIILGVDYS